ncbi:adenylate/guanylate cyclase domain-containing protein [Rhizobium rhizosphaerae]|uniref:Adenylate/guanylate cyclase domain-containing protein n=1 Tax=Xaviernesmea rhizosphaerae TaxID=1672749 RepID=A0ABX3P7F8_9HYPH|nr:adenylate/guanylate cyclase domain-containing protein [Xaviernesmea rhizosphaerae]OQP83702.1 adenylate/guanylate cyclase domain-containing protein [Xaviernesmea rhizosphaerae]
MRLDPSRVRKRLHLASGLILGVFLLTHFSNHALGLISVQAMERGRLTFNLLWRNPLGGIALYGALAVHFVLALEALYRRQTLRMPWKEKLKIVSGLAMPFLLVGHVTATRIDWVLSGYSAGYYDLLPYLWGKPIDRLDQSLALLLAWAHGCLGFWFWLRPKPWYPRIALPLYTLALMVPLLALLGFAAGGRSLGAALPSQSWFMKGRTDPAVLAEIRIALFAGLGLSIAGVLIARLIPMRGKVRIRYPDGRVLSVNRGFSLLEASRAAGIPHVAICGGRGRCSTCRVRVTEGLDRLPPAGKAERATLERINAPDNVRLACQLKPQFDVAIAPILGADNIGLKVQTPEEETGGRERRVALLFCDLRDFTRMSQQHLPFDTVFLLNRYFEMVGEAVEGAGGVVNKFIGDGVFAMFGLHNRLNEASLQALTAATEISHGIRLLNQRFESELTRPFRVAMGMHAGTAIIGRIGYGQAAALTAVGDSVNAASRLEGFAKEYDAELAVSADLLRQAGVSLEDQPTYPISIRGRTGTLETLIVQDARSLAPMIEAARKAEAAPAAERG